ncbi:GIY-YIG nuclease family protein [Gracilibacillus alcaliphilus]|uniref:GIY-YIG nuclease family protein n=1 Tax=Gracilibacillus alcaliphilus TaxID=1401441 RepID=UPI00195D06F7|nr:GIY-YIG nuclease family protein [Gracilibacillus alcaliphilus]MBM7675599.1 Uri superfamily endonuclease [Gracilibacillus alcaliphilus]
MENINCNINKSDTLYTVKALLPHEQKHLTIGKLGRFDFPKGLYVYVGSAKRNIDSRLKRHMQKEKKLRWHFDYLRPYLQIEEIQTFSGEEGECQLFHRLLHENGAEMPVKGFGSSDCKCFSHLFYSQEAVILRKKSH